MQLLEPFTALYFPFSQALQVDPSAPVYPELHLQSVRSSLDCAEADAGGHGKHTVRLRAEYVLLGQRMQFSRDMAALPAVECMPPVH